jgi:hypothetical protein
MHPEVASMAQLAVVVVLTAGSLAAIAVAAFRAMARTKRMQHPAPDDRLEHLQQSVDAIAIEVERIAEAQRFSAKLSAGRSESSTLDR